MGKRVAYIRHLHFFKGFFNKHRVYLKFEFNIDGKWRRGKLEYTFGGYPASIQNVTKLIGAYISNYLKDRDIWTYEETTEISSILGQFYSFKDDKIDGTIYF